MRIPGARVVEVTSIIHYTRNPAVDEAHFRPVQPGRTRTLADMSEAEIAALEAAYGCRVAR